MSIVQYWNLNTDNPGWIAFIPSSLVERVIDTALWLFVVMMWFVGGGVGSPARYIICEIVDDLAETNQSHHPIPPVTRGSNTYFKALSTAV